MKVKEVCNGSADGDGNIIFKQSYWYKNYGTTPTAGDWLNLEYYNLLFGKDSRFQKNFWLACRYTYLMDAYCTFGIESVRIGETGCRMEGIRLYSSNVLNFEDSSALRPVVSIDLKSSGYTLVPEDDTTGTTSKFTLKKGED